jgi:hypothetical protein
MVVISVLARNRCTDITEDEVQGTDCRPECSDLTREIPNMLAPSQIVIVLFSRTFLHNIHTHLFCSSVDVPSIWYLQQRLHCL